MENVGIGNGKNRRKRRTVTITVIVVLAVLLLAAFVLVPMLTPHESVYKTYTVKRGSVSAEAMASGTISAANTTDIELPEGVWAEEVLVETGERVSEGTTLAILDHDSVVQALKSYKAQLAALNSELITMRSGNTDSVNITSPVSGRVKQINCAEGEEAYGAVMVISSDGNMRIDIDNTEGLKLGTELIVVLGDKEYDCELYRIDGKLNVLVDDDDFNEGDAVTVKSEDGTFSSSGTAHINAPVNVYADNGVVEDIYVDLNDRVSMGSRLLRVTHVYSDEYSTKLTERNDCAEDVNLLSNYLISPEVVSTQDGYVKEINIQEGETASSASSYSSASSAGASTSMSMDPSMLSQMQSGASLTSGQSGSSQQLSSDTAFVIAGADGMELKADIDELDITSVKVDQEVRVSINAISDKDFSGHVSFVAGIGSAQSGFSATITIDEQDERILEGMYANAYITTAKAENALLVPMEIVEEDTNGQYVYLDRGERVKTYIETGLSDGMNVEVTSGLQEGDVISYEQTDQRLQGMMRFFMNAGSAMREEGGRGQGQPQQGGNMPDRPRGEG